MKTNIVLTISVCSILLMTACKNKTSSSNSKVAAMSSDSSVKKKTAAGTLVDIKPSGPAPAWAPDIKPQMLAVIEKLDSYGGKSPLKIGAAKARENLTIKDAVNDIIKEYHIPRPVYNIDTTGKEIPVKGGTMHISIYTSRNANGALPIIVYFHAGGFVVANIEVYAASAKILADKVGAVVISVGYRLAPEHKFPTAHNDAYAAYIWAIKNAASINGNPKKIALVGESAGGNLAISTAIKARDAGIMLPSAIVAIYPIVGTDTTTASYIKNANVEPLSRPLMVWFDKQYLNNEAEEKDPRMDLVDANLKGLPPTTVITDEIDPLNSEGLNLVRKLKAAGVSTSNRNYDGVTHEFFGFGAVIPEAKDAENYAVDQLKKVFQL